MQQQSRKLIGGVKYLKPYNSKCNNASKKDMSCILAIVEGKVLHEGSAFKGQVV